MASNNFQNVIALVSQLSPDEQRALLRTLQDKLVSESHVPEAGWKLEGSQLAFMLQHHDEIEAAYSRDDMSLLDGLESSEEYQALFGDMPWDEAYDRFEETWWEDDATDAA